MYLVRDVELYMKSVSSRRLGIRFLIYNPNVITDNQRILKRTVTI